MQERFQNQIGHSQVLDKLHLDVSTGFYHVNLTEISTTNPDSVTQFENGLSRYDKKTGDLVIDLQKVENINLDCLKLLLAKRKELDLEMHKVILLDVSKVVLKKLEFAGFTEFFRIENSGLK